MEDDGTPIKAIVVGTDFSESAHNAFLFAQRLAGLSSARVDVVHVIEPLGDNPLVEAFRSAVDEAEVAQRLLAESDRRMKDFVSNQDIPPSRLRCIHTRANDVAQTLVQYAEGLDADLLVVGTRGHGAIGKVVLGSTASHVIELATLPVLVAARRVEGRSDKHVVLAPLDLSEASHRCLAEAHKLARLLHGELNILHVLEPYALPISLTGIRSIRDLVPDIVDRVRDELENLVQTLEGPYVPYSIHVREGQAPAEIIDAAREIDAGLIAMTRRSYARGDGFLIGSVAERVFRHAPCPVYVLPVTAPQVDANGRVGHRPESVE